MAVITDPLAMATRGVIKTGGTTDPLGLASAGWIVLDTGVVPGPTVLPCCDITLVLQPVLCEPLCPPINKGAG